MHTVYQYKLLEYLIEMMQNNLLADEFSYSDAANLRQMNQFTYVVD